MTVIATVISDTCTAHATDSYVTVPTDSGAYDVIDNQSTKIVCVRRWAGMISVCGLAGTRDGSWMTMGWLKKQIAQVQRFADAESFAHHLAHALNAELARLRFKHERDKGVMMHFTAYEHIDGHRIPELFAITNFSSTTYDNLLPGGVRATRETYGTVFHIDSRGPEHAEPEARHRVREYLKLGVLLYNNGDPALFNPVANGEFDIIRAAADRGILRPSLSPKAYRDLVTWPVELVSNLQRLAFKDGCRVVGGKLHNLSVTPDGMYASDTGDTC